MSAAAGDGVFPDATSPPATSQPARSTAAQVWSALAPLLAGRPRVRESRSGGHTYLRRWERPLTARLPAVPAAVPIYSGAGDTRVLVIDLDASRGGPAAVSRDAAAVTELVRRAGGRVITDESPNGGRHLYVPFGAPLGFHEARDLALALATRTPTMDPSPNQNLTDGLIRPPGSVHPSGGHQILHGPLAAAFDLASTGNPPAVLDNLRTLLAAELAAVTARQQTTAGGATDEIAQAGHLPRPSGARELAPDYLRIATTGLYDTARYRSPSEARQAVLDAAVWAGLTLPAVLARIENGTWPGLSAFYTRYRRPGTRRTAILADWRKALAYVTDQQAKNPTQTLVRKSPTSEPPSHGGAPTITDQDQQRTRGTPGEYQWIRTWWTALGLLEHTRYTGSGRPRETVGAAGDGRGRDENRVPVHRLRRPIPVGRDRDGPHHRRRPPPGAAGRGRPADRPDRERPRPGKATCTNCGSPTTPLFGQPR